MIKDVFLNKIINNDNNVIFFYCYLNVRLVNFFLKMFVANFRTKQEKKEHVIGSDQHKIVIVNLFYFKLKAKQKKKTLKN
jgi:hypothetical protein